MRRLRRLLSKRAERWSERVCVLEGPDLVEAALESGESFEAIYVDAELRDEPRVTALIERAQRTGVRVYALAAGVLQKVADVVTPQPVMAAVHFRVGILDEIEPTGLVLILDNVRDPGNAGTIIRSADAAGASALVLSGDCVDPFNPKTLRASAGSVFHVPVVLAPLEETLRSLRARGVRSYATVLSGASSYVDCDLAGACAVVIGNESSGLSASAVVLCDASMTIPMVGRAESLNAGVAASLIAFEALRQRRGTTGA